MIYYVVATVFAGLSLAYMYMGTRPSKHGGRARSMSVSSSAMVRGAFPTDCNVVVPVINIAILVNRSPSMEGLKDAFSGLFVYDRFRGVPEQDESGEWIFRLVDPDINKHIILATVANEEEMKQYIEKCVASPLPTNQPYWCVHRVETLSGISCVIVRIHHVIGDGISLVGVIDKIFRDEKLQKLSMDAGMRVPKDGMPLLTKIFKTVKSFASVLLLGVSPYDSDIAFTSPNKSELKMTPFRKTLYFPTVQLSFVKALKNAAGVTVNDILMSATAGAIRKYSEYRGNDFSNPKKIHNRLLVPIALFRSQETMKNPSNALNNKFTFLSVDMHLNASDAMERVKACSKEMTAFKSSPQAFVQIWFQQSFLSHLPMDLQRKFAHDVFSRHSLIFSNVPGPEKAITLGGERVAGMQVIFPNILPQVILISYGGSVFMNMSIDDHLITDSHMLCKYYLEELRDCAHKLGVPCDDSVVLSAKSPGGAFETVIA